MKKLRFVAASALLCLLAACGGGSSNNDVPPGGLPADYGLSVDRTDPVILVQEPGQQTAAAPIHRTLTYGTKYYSVNTADLVDWVAFTPGSGHDDSPVDISIQANAPFTSRMAQGHYQTQLEFMEFSTPDSKFWAQVTVPLTLVIAHSFGIQHSDLAVEQGQTGSSAVVHVSLQADSVRWAATTSAPWLAVDQATGNGSGTLALSVSDPTLAPGTHDATVSVTDLDYNVVETMSVTVHVEPRTLVTRAHGIGLTAAPGWNVLSASVPVTDGAALPSTWSATSDQSWLVLDTPSGSSGTSLTLHADPSGLAAGMHYAQVMVTPTTVGVSGTQSVRVGLYVSASPASTAVPVDTYQAPDIGCDPTRPYCYTFSAAGVAVFNLFSGQAITTIPVTGFAATISPDGRTLYVANDRLRQIVPVDLDTMTVLPALASSDVPSRTDSLPSNYDLVAAEIGGRLVLLTNELHILDASTGQTLRDFSPLVPTPVLGLPAVGVSHDGRLLVVRSLDKTKLYRMEVDTDGSYAVGISEVHQEPAQTIASPIVFLGDDSGFFCSSDKLRRYSSGNLTTASTVGSLNLAYVPTRDDANFYLFTPAVSALDGNSFTPGVLDLRGADVQTLQTLESDFAPTGGQKLFMSADQHRLVLFTDHDNAITYAVDFIDLP